MTDTTFVGVQNVSGAAVRVRHAGDPITFEKDEIKVVPASLGAHLLSWAAYSAKEVGEHKFLERKQPFKSVPLAEAFKHVKEPENASIARAKKEAELAERQEAILTDKIMLRFRREGWTKPAEKQEPQNQGKNNVKL
jgi:hypothetical protein